MARNMSPDEYQELGRRYYKLKQYDKAVEAFTQGIEAFPTVSLYDHRAATYDKLEDFNAAIKDGRDMIRLDKKNVKGYLRTASVLEKIKKPETALGIYKYGMKNVPVGENNFELLQQLHNKLTRKLSPAQAIDPFTVLPIELAEMVLEYISFRHMVNCMRVSRGWRDYLSQRPKLWLHLDLSGARKPVPRSFVNMAFKRSESRMTRVTVHRFEHMDMLKNLAKAAKHLTELEFISVPHTMSSTLVDIVKSGPSLRKFVVHPEITLNTATTIVSNRPGFEQVTLNGVKFSNYQAVWQGPFPDMKTFTMQLVDSMSAYQISLTDLLSQAPSLESITLSNLSNLNEPMGWPEDLAQLPPLTSIVLKRVFCTFIPVLPPTLQKLVIEHNGMRLLDGIKASLLRARVPELTHLTLSGFSALSADRLDEFLDSCVVEGSVLELRDAKPLKYLTIRGLLRNGDGDTGLFKGPGSLLGRSPRILTRALETLDIATMPCNDDEIEHLLTYETGLTSIDLSCTNITGASLKMLADKLPTLKTIKADNCPKINGRDAIHYAERKGISVSCQMGEQKGSRRIRYA
ncbi:hypothetical protein EJ02DRAFT_411903 [Clathrospora elynae]|uniref:F-box domain-containing protein n=1 Tax=Clathrospora elynae TaxID=706981 RepID=A0A6A5SD72_9PLEO|nr:hypothetical protein EJ02DRAFT_411903 [Clathrospora elynae]